MYTKVTNEYSCDPSQPKKLKENEIPFVLLICVRFEGSEVWAVCWEVLENEMQRESEAS